MGLLKNITNYFDQKIDKSLDFDNARKSITISFVAIIAIIFYLVFGVISLINESYLLALILGIASALNYLIYLYIHKTLKINSCINANLIVTGSVFLYCMVTGGAFGTGYLWIFPFPILAISLKGLDRGTRVSFLFLVFIIAACIINLYVPGLPDYKLSFSLRLIGSYLAIYAIIYVFEFLRIQNYHKMRSLLNDSILENKRKDDFLSKLSHQIRTPLNNITLIYNLVDRTKLPADQQDLFDTIIASTNNLVNVVNNIVQVSAIDIDEKNQSPVSFNIETTIQNTLKLFTNQYKERLEIDFKTKTIKTNFIGNPVRIKQLFLNIIENIIKIGSEEKLKLAISINSQNIENQQTQISIDIVCPPIDMKKDSNENYFVASSRPIIKIKMTLLKITWILTLPEKLFSFIMEPLI